jgi:hypothetical protein
MFVGNLITHDTYRLRVKKLCCLRNSSIEKCRAEYFAEREAIARNFFGGEAFSAKVYRFLHEPIRGILAVTLKHLSTSLRVQFVTSLRVTPIHKIVPHQSLDFVRTSAVEDSITG